MNLQLAIALLQDLLANHKGDRSRIQKELGNLRSEGFEVKVALNGRTTALVADVERLLTSLEKIEVMRQRTLVQALDAPTEALIMQAEPIELEVVEEPLQATFEAPVEQTVTPSVDVRQGAEAAELETDAETGIELVEAISEGVTEVVEPEPKPSTRKTLTEIMAMPMPESTAGEERELAMLEDLFASREQSEGDKSQATLLPETLLQNSSQLHRSAKSFESIVLVLVILVLVFKAMITVIKVIEESQAATVSAKSFEQMYVAVSQKVRYRSKGFVKGLAVA